MTRFSGCSISLLSAFFLLTQLISPAPVVAAPSSLVILGAKTPTFEHAQKLAPKPHDETEHTEHDDASTEHQATSSAEDEHTKSKSDEDKPAKDAGDKKNEDKEIPAKKPASDSDNAKEKSEKKPKPHKVKQGKLRVAVSLSGIFAANEMSEVALRPEVWSQFKVVEAVEHGTQVKKGDVLVRFDPEKIEAELEKQSLDQLISELTLLQTEEEMPRLKRLMEIAYQNAHRTNERMKADYEYYHATERPSAVQLALFRYKSAEEQLASAQEELDQLQQMYEADELTEETEEIVLRRQRFAVETAKMVLQINKESRDLTLNVTIPRNDEYYETALEQAELAFQQAKTAWEIGLTRKNYDMEKLRKSRAISIERHGKLLSDKALMVLRAPTDGVVYYGQNTHGKWSQIATIAAKLKPSATVTPNTVLMTIVNSDQLHVESTFTEKELPSLKTGQSATIIPAGDKELELTGAVKKLDSIPGASNKFKIALQIDADQVPDWLVAGMTCSAKVLTYENKEAVIAPLSMIHTDKTDKKLKYVLLVDPAHDKPFRREVKLGRKQDKNVEILAGLKPGDLIVKEEK